MRNWTCKRKLVHIKDKIGSRTFGSVHLEDFKSTDAQTVQFNGVFKKSRTD